MCYKLQYEVVSVLGKVSCFINCTKTPIDIYKCFVTYRLQPAKLQKSQKRSLVVSKNVDHLIRNKRRQTFTVDTL